MVFLHFFSLFALFQNQVSARALNTAPSPTVSIPATPRAIHGTLFLARSTIRLHQTPAKLGKHISITFSRFLSIGKTETPSFTQFYLVLPDFTEFYRTLPSFTEFYRVLPSFTEFYRVLPGFRWNGTKFNPLGQVDLGGGWDFVPFFCHFLKVLFMPFFVLFSFFHVLRKDTPPGLNCFFLLSYWPSVVAE